MFRNFELLIAFRYLKSRKNESFVSIIAAFSFVGIALGVATLIVVMAVMDGFRNELLDRILGLNGHIIVNGYNKPIDNYEKVASKIISIDEVKSAFPIIDSQVMISSNNNLSGGLVRGIKFSDLSSLKILSKNIINGQIDFDKKNSVLIGEHLANKLNLFVGDKVTLISSKSTSTPFGGVPRSMTFLVGGIFNVGMYEYDSTFIFMPLDLAQLFFQYNDTVPSIEIRVNNPQIVNSIRKDIMLITNSEYSLIDWQQINSSYINVLKIERNVMFLILSLIIIIAAFNIISSLIMLVKDKSRDIAILRTVGSSKTSIMRIFIYVGASIGFLGTILGSILGSLFAKYISNIQSWIEYFTGSNLFAAEFYYLSQLPSNLVWSNVFSVILLSLILSLLATIYPSWKAAKLDPIEILRYE